MAPPPGARVPATGPPRCGRALARSTGTAADRSGVAFVPHHSGTVRRLPIPSFLRDLGEPPDAPGTLLVAALSMAAAGLNPQVLSPSVSTVQAAIREQPQVNSLVLLATLAGAALLFAGGVLGDTDGRRRILLAALGALFGANLLALALPDGPLFVLSRVAGVAAAYAVLPFALAMVATTYGGVVRATAIGIVYAAYGAGTAAAPVLMTILGPTGPWWPGFLVAMVVAGIAFWRARPRAPNLPAIARDDRSYVVSTAVWAFAIVVITVGVAVGVIIGFAQAAPLFQLPLFLHVVLGYGVIVASLAIAPFVIALVI